uniref:Uncharacterized protein n=1 Tax=Pseudonaja textilis TaxID=8673 RepID=A0A670YZK0_PSETE
MLGGHPRWPKHFASENRLPSSVSGCTSLLQPSASENGAREDSPSKLWFSGRGTPGQSFAVSRAAPRARSKHPLDIPVLDHVRCIHFTRAVSVFLLIFVVVRRQLAELGAESDSGEEHGPVLESGEGLDEGSASDTEMGPGPSERYVRTLEPPQSDISEAEEQREPVPSFLLKMLKPDL